MILSKLRIGIKNFLTENEFLLLYISAHMRGRVRNFTLPIVFIYMVMYNVNVNKVEPLKHERRYENGKQILDNKN